MRMIAWADTELLVLAYGVEQFAAHVDAAIADGERRGLRSPVYEQLREIIRGGPTYGSGVVVRLNVTPPPITALWQPIVSNTEPPPAIEQDGVA